MSHYKAVFHGCGLAWLAGVGLALYSFLALLEAKERLHVEQVRAREAAASARGAAEVACRLEAAMPPLRQFLSSWKPHLHAEADERELGRLLRSGLEGLAQQRLSLVTDQVLAPEPGQLHFGERSLRVQRLGVRASGESLGALIAWLGEAEAMFPYARVEAWELAASGGANSCLRVTLVHPLQGARAGAKEVQQ